MSNMIQKLGSSQNVIFLIGIIITLKIRILDNKEKYKPLLEVFYFGDDLFKKNELVAFVLGTLLNIVFLIYVFPLQQQGKIDEAVYYLNYLIFYDTAIVIRNLYIVIKMYHSSIFKKTDLIEETNDASLTNPLVPNDDLFHYWLNKLDSEWIQRALTDDSYKKEYERNNHIKFEGKTNFELATLGDAVIKSCLSNILLDNVTKLSKAKEEYEKDSVLVKVIAKHYNLVDYIKKDTLDEKKPIDYNYIEKKGNNNPHKYIATAVEAVIGAIFKETNNIDAINQLIAEWKKLIDTSTEIVKK